MKQPAKYHGLTQPFLPELSVRKAFPTLRLGEDPDPVPVWHAYSFRDDSRTWLPWNHLRQLGRLEDWDLDDLIKQGSLYSPEMARFGATRHGHTVERCRSVTPQGFWFFEASLVIALPSLQGPVYTLLCSKAEQPPFPYYNVNGAPDGQYVSVKTLRRVCLAHRRHRTSFRTTN